MNTTLEGRRVPPLDGVRGLAVLLVIAGHSVRPQSQPLAAAGVTLFFVLSGYLITGILLRDADESGRPRGLRRFYGRRARRLLPALVLLLAFELAMRLVTGRSLLPVLYAATYTTNIAIVGNDTSSLSHTWSLALEEQFYLVWPLVLPFVLRSRRPLAIVAGLAVMSAALRTAIYFGYPTAWLFAYFGPFTRADAILAGCALAIALRRGPERVARGIPRPAIAGALIVLGLSFVWDSGHAAVVCLPLLVAASSVLVAHLVTTTDGLIARVFSFRPLRGMGRISYGMYLWHFLVLVAVSEVGAPPFITTLVVTSAIATASWFLVERRFLQPRGDDSRDSPTSVHNAVGTHTRDASPVSSSA